MNIYTVSYSTANHPPEQWKIEASSPATAISRALRGRPHNRDESVSVLCELHAKNMTMDEYRARLK